MSRRGALASMLTGMAVGAAALAVVWTLTWRQLGVPAWRGVTP